MLDLQAHKRIIDESVKLTSRAEKITVTQAQFFEYLIKTQRSHQKFSQAIQAQVRGLQDSLQNKSYYSSDKLNLMKAFLKMQMSFYAYIEKIANANISDLTRIQSANTKCIDRSAKCDNFMKNLNQYYNDSKSYNKKYAEYEANSKKLEQEIMKYKQLQDPVNYYNPNKSTAITKNIQKNYQQCENTENGLINHLQLLEQKRKLLGQNIKNIRQEYIVFLQQQMQHIVRGAHCMADAKKDDLYSSQKITYIGYNIQNSNSVFPEMIQVKPNHQTNAYQDDGLLSQIQVICLNGRNSFTGSKSQLKILEDRCKVFRKKIFDTTEQYTNFQKSFLEEIIRQIAMYEKNEKQFDLIFRQVFKIGGSSNNSQENFFDKFNKYFGSSLFKIMNFCFHITDTPIKCMSAIKRVFLQNDDRLRTMINQKQDQFKHFKKKLQFIISQAKSEFKSHFSRSSLEQNNRTLAKNLQNFKNIVQQFLAIQKKIDNQFNSSIIVMIEQIKIQYQQVKLNKIIIKEHEGMAALEQWNSDSQIVNLMKDDRKYDILFDDQSLGSGAKFKSLLGNKKCEKTKNVLRHKNIRISNPQTQIIKRASCCGGLSSNNKEPLYQAYIQKNKEKRFHGKLLISQKGVNFLQSKMNPFSEKLQFAIPQKQIKSYQKFKSQNQQGLRLNTFMGPINIFSSEIQSVEQSLKNDLGIDQNFEERIMSKKQNQFSQQRNGKNGFQTSQSKMDIKMDSRIYEKIFSKNDSRQNRSSQVQTATRPGSTVMQKISYDGSNAGIKVGNKGKTKVVGDDTLLKSLFQKMRITKYFAENVKVVNKQNLNQFQYQLQNQYYKCSIFEKRACQLNQYQKSLIMDIVWKIAFPQYPILRSFFHSETVKVELKDNLVKINVKQKSRNQMHLQYKKKFYQQIDKMNLNLSNSIVQFCSREGEVVIEQDPLEQSFMQSQVSFNQEAKFSVNSFSDYRQNEKI